MKTEKEIDDLVSMEQERLPCLVEPRIVKGQEGFIKGLKAGKNKEKQDLIVMIQKAEKKYASLYSYLDRKYQDGYIGGLRTVLDD